MRWFEKLGNKRNPNLIIKNEGETYLTRWWLIPRNRFFNIYLHKISVSDEPTFHDHPWNFFSFVLQGEIFEHFIRGGRLCRENHFYFRRKDKFHFLEMVDQKPVWTLLITGRLTQKWGFLSEHGWIPFDKYEDRQEVETFNEFNRKF